MHGLPNLNKGNKFHCIGFSDVIVQLSFMLETGKCTTLSFPSPVRPSLPPTYTIMFHYYSDASKYVYTVFFLV